MSWYAIWIVTSILCGMAGAWIAKNKGKDPVVGFFVGVGLNVVGLLLVLFVPKMRKRVV